MNYKVLYRKYRPSTFDDVVGQTNTINLLKDSIINDKISHAYIFSGPRGTGKTSTAKIFAKAINCLQNNNGNPCGICSNCLNNNISSDIYEIDAASNNGVDQIREIIDNIKLIPANSRYKVYIIDEVHMLSISAFNALLLTLEEPPSHVVFILATTNIENVPITVLSRCQRLDFKKISKNDIINHLKYVAKQENIKINDDAVNEIAEFSSGGLRDALSILDQLSKLNDEITEKLVLENIGLISNAEINKMLESLDENNVEKVLNFTKKARDISADYKSLINKIIECIKIKAIEIKKNINCDFNKYEKYKNLAFELASSIYKCNVNIDSYSILELILLSYNSNEIISREIISNYQKEEKSREIPVIKPKDSLNSVVKITKTNINSTFENKNEIISREIICEEQKKDKTWEITENKPKNEISSKIIDYDNFVNIRINNCFVTATKNFKEKVINEFSNFVKTLDDKTIKGILIDVNVAIASNDIIILIADLKSKANLINEYNENISQLYKNKYGDYKFAAIDKHQWQIEMNKYKENIKNNIKYVLKEEPILNSEPIIIFDDIFNNDKIEIV